MWLLNKLCGSISEGLWGRHISVYLNRGYKGINRLDSGEEPIEYSMFYEIYIIFLFLKENHNIRNDFTFRIHFVLWYFRRYMININ